MSDLNLCQVCKKPAAHKCGGCHVVFYCSKEHQKEGWKKHKKYCKPFKICEDPTLGRYLVSTKNIKAGDIVLREPPLIWGPSQITPPVCLGCGKLLRKKDSKPCAECGWPMCSEICQKAPCHIPECRYTVQKGEKVSINNFEIVHPAYQCLTVLRCLYQKQFLPEVWKKLDKLESHCEHRKNTPKYDNEKVYIAEFIRRFFKLADTFSQEEILRISGIVMVNGHEVPLSDPPYVSIYESSSMFEHSCRPNCAKSFTDKGDILIVAGEEIKKGTHLTICYTNPLWDTINRRHHLYETKFFWCLCPRCKDPTEYGTYFSSVKCQDSSCDGFLLPATFLESTFNRKTQDWKCNACDKTFSSNSVYDILEKIGRDLSELKKGDVESCKKFLEDSMKYLHPNHVYLTEVKIALSELIGQEYDGILADVTDEDLKLKEKTCREMLEFTRKLVPIENRVRGLLFFELHAATAEKGRRLGVVGKSNEMIDTLIEAKSYLEHSINLLKNEPSCLPEGKICRQAQKNLKDIHTIIMTNVQMNANI